MAVTDYESLVGLLISRWVSRKLLPCYESVPRRSRALRRSGQPEDERLRETERTRGWRTKEEGVEDGGEVGDRGEG